MAAFAAPASADDKYYLVHVFNSLLPLSIACYQFHDAFGVEILLKMFRQQIIFFVTGFNAADIGDLYAV
jgi:hypothetical protein